ncbi:Sugar transporter [Coemansia erecta]|uniref:Sugar transporter SWEET1 n=1 Tax=Coemansia erecta TaxID=147472 RepID=A0A9W7XWJ3_9FUNG|nr:Sugar transporter [Coemansia erecta]
MSLVPILAVGANIAMYVSQLSIIGLLRRASKAQTSLPLLPSLASFLNSILWLKYGFIKHDQAISLVNSLGTLIALYILGCFWWYDSQARRTVETRCLLTFVCAIGLIGYVDYAEDEGAKDVFGLVCCGVTLLFLGAPLGQIGNVVRLRDASVLLPGVAVLAFSNNVLWGLYGHMHQDVFMVVPNVIGGVLCAVQLGLIAKYGRAAAKLPPVAVVGGSIPMTQL